MPEAGCRVQTRLCRRGAGHRPPGVPSMLDSPGDQFMPPDGLSVPSFL